MINRLPTTADRCSPTPATDGIPQNVNFAIMSLGGLALVPGFLESFRRAQDGLQGGKFRRVITSQEF